MNEKNAFHHIPVLANEILALLDPQPNERYLDLTLGGAGHATLIAERIGPDAKIVAFDRDPAAIQAGLAKLKQYNTNITHFNAPFSSCDATLRQHYFNPQNDAFDIILADLGVSSTQLDQPERGFSWRYDAPLDMRMASRGTTALELLQQLDTDTLANILYQFGDIRKSRPLAAAIKRAIQNNTLYTTRELADLSEKILGRTPKGKAHAATRVFQAIRIAVNDEYGELTRMLAKITQWTQSGTRLAILSFHSGEDRIVKQTMKSWQNPCKCPPQLPVCTCNQRPLGQSKTRRAVTAQPDEKEKNPRATSAKLRVFTFT